MWIILHLDCYVMNHLKIGTERERKWQYQREKCRRWRNVSAKRPTAMKVCRRLSAPIAPLQRRRITFAPPAECTRASRSSLSKRKICMAAHRFRRVLSRCGKGCADGPQKDITMLLCGSNFSVCTTVCRMWIAVSVGWQRDFVLFVDNRMRIASDIEAVLTLYRFWPEEASGRGAVVFYKTIEHLWWKLPSMPWEEIMLPV